MRIEPARQIQPGLASDNERCENECGCSLSLLAWWSIGQQGDTDLLLSTPERNRPLRQSAMNAGGNPDGSGAAVATSTAVSPCAPEEIALIDRVCQGDNEAFYKLIEPYQRPVFLAALSVVSNEADAEEVAQEALLKAFKNLKSFRRESKLSTWLIQIAINESRMRIRKDRKHLYESTDEPANNDEEDYRPKDYADWREIPSESLQRKELREALSNALASLSPKYREVFILRDIQHLNISETAKLLGITEASVKTRLLRARLQMRDALAPGIDGTWTIGDGSWKKVRPW
jgi:RNA polymerase sigma-70 factor (ECF subfamily)